MAWSSYRRVESIEKDFADLKAHDVGLVSMRARDAAEAKEPLDLARRFGMKYEIGLPDITESAELVRQAGLQPVDALMIGGVYQGKAIDRHLFRFTAARHEIVIEPPVYNRKFAYTLGSRSTGAPAAGEWIAHYYPDMPPPVRAEVVVPLKKFDGRQHLKVVPASIALAPAGAKPENDTVTTDMPPSSETRSRRLYRLSFDLTGLDRALLHQVGLAVYWPYHGSKQYWMFGRGEVSAAAPSTQQALRDSVQRTLKLWTEAAGGRFPHDVVLAIRFGDECFYVTGHTYQSSSQAVSYPLWDYSAPGIQAYRQRAGRLEYPRTWGFPEIYGPDAYAWWLYSLHERCAALAGVVREEIAKTAAGLLVLRNTTRLGVFDVANDHDGSGPELLTRNLDIVHLDPYPVTATAYGAAIPRDMSYYSGLARRYRRPLVPWMQAHTYGSLQHVSPEQVDRMAEEQWRQGVDAIMWLGYGDTFPKVRPDSWERAAVFHKRLAVSPPPKPVAKMAVLRAYAAWALTSKHGDLIRNPADWTLQQLLEVWAVHHGQPYDVFELPPKLSKAEQDALARELRKYSHVVSTAPRQGAWVIGAGTAGQLVDPATAKDLQRRLEEELISRGWLKGAK
ncbi:MAG: hypothetical protein AAB225_00530 [Acidobacteriota bacterium]